MFLGNLQEDFNDLVNSEDNSFSEFITEDEYDSLQGSEKSFYMEISDAEEYELAEKIITRRKKIKDPKERKQEKKKREARKKLGAGTKLFRLVKTASGKFKKVAKSVKQKASDKSFSLRRKRRKGKDTVRRVTATSEYRTPVGELQLKEKEQSYMETINKEQVRPELSYDSSADVDALLNGQELSDEFKVKASTILEASVKKQVDDHVDKIWENIEQQVEKDFEEAQTEVKKELVEKVDSYLNYVVEEWMQQNEIAIESGIKSELTEEFIQGLKTLFSNHYIEVPEDKVDVISELTTKVEELENKLGTQINENIELTKQVTEKQRLELLQQASADLVDTEVEKLKELTESIDFDGDVETFVEKVKTLKENYFPKAVTTEEEVDSEEPSFPTELSSSMTAYTQAIARSIK